MMPQVKSGSVTHVAIITSPVPIVMNARGGGDVRARVPWRSEQTGATPTQITGGSLCDNVQAHSHRAKANESHGGQRSSRPVRCKGFGYGVSMILSPMP